MNIGDEELKQKMLTSWAFADSSHGVDVAFSFDTTGSMYACLQEVRKKVSETVTQLLSNIKNIRIAIISHGDYCDDVRSFRTLHKLDFSSDLNKIVSFIENAPATGGGDAPEAYELALKEANSLSWNPKASKALVMIGDCEPHPPSYTTSFIYWRYELEKLYRYHGVKIYSVQAYHNHVATPFYQEMARRTGGVHLNLRSFSVITTMFEAVCYCEASPEKLKEFRAKILSQNQLDSDKQEIFDKLQFITPPPALGQQNSDWWSIELDRNKNTQYELLGSKYVYKSVPISNISKQVDIAYSKMKAIKRVPVINDSSQPAMTRTGGRILDTFVKVPELMPPSLMFSRYRGTSAIVDTSYTVKKVGEHVYEVVKKGADDGKAEGKKREKRN